jgi:hypothetical protein
MDVTQDSERNVFSCSMQSIYRKCNEDPNRNGISRRSLNRLEAHLLQNGPNNPFMIASRNLANGIIDADKKNILDGVKIRVAGILSELYVSMDGLFNGVEVDDEEAEARSKISKLLQVQHDALEDVSKDYEAIKAKYGKPE